jgi:hypothetical protein
MGHSAIANAQILARKPQIFMYNPQIANMLIYTKYCTNLSHHSHKSLLLKQLFIMYKFVLEHYLLCL